MQSEFCTAPVSLTRFRGGWAAGIELDRLRDVFREPDATTARGWNDAEVDGLIFRRKRGRGKLG